MRKIAMLVVFLLTVSCDPTAEDGGVVGDHTRVLVIANNAADLFWLDTTYVKQMEGMDFTIFNANDSIPTLGLYKDHDVVLLFENGNFSGSDTAGNLAYRYVMDGGNIVIATFYWQGRNNGRWGDMNMIAPIDSGSCRYATDSLGTMEDHPLTRGLSKLVTHYRGGPLRTINGGTAVAHWANGDILMAHNKPDGRVVAVSQFPTEPRYSTWTDLTSFYRLFENALLYAAWGNTREAKSGSHPVTARPTNKTPSKTQGSGNGTH